MDVKLSRNLSVTVTDYGAEKMKQRTQTLQDRLPKVESKILGICQVMLGLIVTSYSVPLFFTEYTEVIRFGVPWWNGILFIVAGSAAVEAEKRASMHSLRVCLLVTLTAVLASAVALIFYSIDLHNNSIKNICESEDNDIICGPDYYATVFSRGLKCCLLLFTILQFVLSSSLLYLIYKERRSFNKYMSLMENVPPTPT